jgi:YD repeat-containing protein
VETWVKSSVTLDSSSGYKVFVSKWTSPYSDGTQVATATSAITANATIDPVLIGFIAGGTSTDCFNGYVDDLTLTPPGGSARTTTYTHDDAGQVTGVGLPDGTSLSLEYDAAHRLTEVTDARGNKVTYTLDKDGNRIADEIRDSSGTLQRTISRSFDALSRLQQVTGAAQ